MSEPTFKTRVEQFWAWFSTVAERFYDTIEDGRCGDLMPEVGDFTNDLFPGFVWVFGPGPHDVGGHSFTLSGNGILNLQFLAEYWQSQAPVLPGWTFHASRQPGDINPDFAIQINDFDFSFGQTLIVPTVDDEGECVDVVMCNEQFEHVDDDLAMHVMFIFLDEVLGEYGTGQWVGDMSVESHANEDGAIPLLGLRDFLHDLEIKRGWKKGTPTNSYIGYELNPIDERFPRSDTLFGSTCNFRIVSEHLESGGNLENPIPATGANFVYVQFDVSILPQGSEVEFRSGIADAIDESLRREAVGQHLGGAFGSENAYIDFLLFDTERGLEVIRRALAGKDLPSGTSIHFFAREDQSRSIMI